MKNNRVLVLMATYNGEKYIEEQIISIKNQVSCEVSFLISDDGSKDKTIDVIKKIKDTLNINLEIIKNNLKSGFGNNFYNLFYSADVNNYDYIALADQDDIFFNNKFSISIDKLNSNNAVGISSAVKCFGSSSRILYQSTKITKYDFLFEGAGQGNTFVMSKNFFKEFQSFIKNNKQHVLNFYFHDWLLYLFCRSKNYNWVFCNKPLTHYRIHSDNVVGDKYSLNGIYLRLKKITNGWYLNEIYKANSISRLINPDIVNLKKLNFYSLYKLIVLNGRRKITDRVLLLITFILANK